VTGENYGRAKELFLQVCSLDEASRGAILVQQCAGDPALLAEVESLLAHHGAQTILPGPAPPRSSPPRSASSSSRSTARRAWRLIAREVTERKGTYLAALLALLLLVGGGVWAHYGVEDALRTVLRDELQTVLDADVTALELWLREQQAEAKRWARQADVREAIVELAKVRGNATPADVRSALLASPALVDLREALQGYIEEEEGRTAYAAIDRVGLVLAAREDADVAIRLNGAGVDSIQSAFAGETRVTRPRPQGSLTDERPERLDTPMIWVSTPVLDEAGKIVASLNLAVRADDQFTRILSVARIGKSGETYAFDERGWFLSDSRFTEDLKSWGLIPNEPQARATFNVQVRDPGVDLAAGRTPELPRPAQPLTKMARLAIARRDGVDVDGYRDYRGVKVIGAWKWLAEYGFGVVTEVDYAEAYAPLRYPIIASWLPLAVLVVAAGGLLYSAFHIARLQRQVGVAQRLGPYTLEEKIGEGGMGVVYRARHALLRRPTAVKLLKPDHMSDMAVARFEREVQLASQLTHPNTIEIYDFGETADGVFYYAMEYLPGASLAELIQIEGVIPSARAIHILRQACGSLAEAHAVGLVHRDIKPQNIMLCERGGQADFVKVLDFGLVKTIEGPGTSDLTTTRSLTGTPLYMAPERLKDPLSTDPRSDVYSLGAVAYNLLTGRSIFKVTNELDVLYHVMNVVPEPPAQLNASIPAELSRLIVSCLAKDPHDRPESAEVVLQSLDAIPIPVPWTETDARRWWKEHGAAVTELRRKSVADTVDVVAERTAARSNV